MAQCDFKSLSPDTIIDGLESAGFNVDGGLLPLNSYESRVYQFHDENLTKYVTKFYRPQRWKYQINNTNQNIKYVYMVIVTPVIYYGEM
jgi:Ser/Thr protein kinase RdoA (MazF antagonist)